MVVQVMVTFGCPKMFSAAEVSDHDFDSLPHDTSIDDAGNTFVCRLLGRLVFVVQGGEREHRPAFKSKHGEVHTSIPLEFRKP